VENVYVLIVIVGIEEKMIFGKTQKIKDSFEFLELQRRVSSLEIEVEKLKTHINSLRGMLNRRMKEYLGDIEPEETIKNPDGLDMLRKAKK